MAEEARYQVGDQCYTGLEAAVQAHIARLSPTVVQRDLGNGGGLEAVMMTPKVFNSPAIDGAYIDYLFEGLTSYDQIRESMLWHPAPCVNDGAMLGRLADSGEVFLLFLAAVIVVWGGKQVLNLFTGDSERT